MERNIKDYAKEVAAHVKEYLPEELSDCTVKVLEVRKGQTMVSEILVRKEGVSFSPLLPVSQFFNDNVNEEDAAMRIVDMVGKMYREDHSLYSSYDIEDYNICSQKLFIRVYGRKEKLPVPWPHKEIAFGLDAVCYIDTSENSDEGKTINVTSDMMDNWGKSFEEVFAAAAANMLQCASFRPMNDVLTEMNDEYVQSLPIPEEMKMAMKDAYVNSLVQNPMHVLMAGYYGAGAVAVPELLKNTLGEGCYYIMPSSLYEVIVIPVGNETIEELMEIVNSVNNEAVSEEDQLSNRVYRYENGKLNCCFA